jgi:N-carbamoyl-L-amino-acid hydrolase
MALELRARTTPELDAIEAAVFEQAAAHAEAERLGLAVEPVGRWEPVALNRWLQELVAQTASELGLSSLELSSGAGHDAQALATVAPTGMIFVPSTGGISHDAAEHTNWEDCVNGANVLLGTALRLATGAAC